MNNSQSKTITIGPVRVYHHNLFTPYRQGGGTDEQKYTLTMLIPKSDTALKASIDAAIEGTAQEALHTKWNGTAPVTLLTPLHDGDGVRANGEPFGRECSGCFVMTANSKDRPELVDNNVQPIIDPNEIYRGMWAYVSVSFFAYMRSGKKGIGCGLGPVMKYKDDERLGGRITAQAAFSGIMKPAVIGDDAPPFGMAPVPVQYGIQA